MTLITDCPIEQQQADYEDILMGILDFCGCGIPMDVLILSYFFFDLLSLERKRINSDIYDLDDIKIIREKYIGEYQELFLRYFFDNKELLEHCGSVHGCWISEKGKNFHNSLKDYIKLEEPSTDEKLIEFLKDFGDLT